MTAIIGAQEFCNNGHLRTPATTYIRPNGHRSCRTCAGTTEVVGRTPSERFTPEQLAALRYLVRCVHCGAVPTETGEEREVTDGNGGTVVLPVVVTPHPHGCPAAPRVGRPPREHKMPQVPAGSCAACGAEMWASAPQAPSKRYCDVVCRKTAHRRRQAGVR